MNVRDLLTKPVDRISSEERMRLVSLLLADSNRDIGFVNFSADDLKPGEIRKIAVRNYATFWPTRLLILNQTREVTESITTERRSVLSRTTETRLHTRLIDIPSDAWSVSGMFFGPHNVLGALAVPISGAAFDQARPFKQLTVAPGCDVTLTISHNLTTPANFRALLCGDPLR